MYLRLRKRRKPLPSETTPISGETVEPESGAQPAADTSSGDWVEAERPSGGPADGVDIGTTRHPNRGNARESSRGSHR